MPYPEGYQPNSAPGQTLPFSEITNFEYELGRPYIQSHGLSFSYGAMKGRATNWAAQLAAKPLAMSVIGVTAAGFQGLTLDADGYPGAVPAVVATLRRLLGVAPRYSADHTFLFYDLRPYARRLRARHSGRAAARAARGDAVPAAAELLDRSADGRQPIGDDAARGAHRRRDAAAQRRRRAAAERRRSGRLRRQRSRQPPARAAGAGAGDDDGVGVRGAETRRRRRRG